MSAESIPATRDTGVVAVMTANDVSDLSRGFSLHVRTRTAMVDCGRGETCSLRVRLDEEPSNFVAEGLGNGSMLIRGYEAGRIDAAKSLRIEVPMYNRSAVYFDFTFDVPARVACAPERQAPSSRAD